MAIRFAISGLFFLVVSAFSTEVIFSRRVYNNSGPSYQQLWTWDPATGAMKALTKSARNHYQPACRDGRITFVSPERHGDNSKLWSFNPATGEERPIGKAPAPADRRLPKGGCAKAGPFEACVKNEYDLFLSRAGKPAAHFHIQKNVCLDAHGGTSGACATPILLLQWSPHGKRLLVGELGLDTNSTAPQFDYYVVDTATLKLQKVGSAEQQSAIWLPGGEELIYSTPRDLAELPGAKRKRGVWVQQLMLFNTSTGKAREITSGISSNQDATVCVPKVLPPKPARPR